MNKKIKSFLLKLIKKLKALFKKKCNVSPVDPPKPPVDSSEYILTENDEQLSTENGDNLIV